MKKYLGGLFAVAFLFAGAAHANKHGKMPGNINLPYVQPQVLSEGFTLIQPGALEAAELRQGFDAARMTNAKYPDIVLEGARRPGLRNLEFTRKFPARLPIIGQVPVEGGTPLLLDSRVEMTLMGRAGKMGSFRGHDMPSRLYFDAMRGSIKQHGYGVGGRSFEFYLDPRWRTRHMNKSNLKGLMDAVVYIVRRGFEGDAPQGRSAGAAWERMYGNTLRAAFRHFPGVIAHKVKYAL